MDIDEAYAILGLSRPTTFDKIDERFRVLAFERHPDRGGTHESMTELNEAKLVAMDSLVKTGTLVPAHVLSQTLDIIARREEKQSLDDRVTKTQEQLRLKSTNKLRRYRRTAAIFAALFAAAIFVRQEFPLEIFLTSQQQFVMQLIEQQERREGESGLVREQDVLRDSDVELFFDTGQLSRPLRERYLLFLDSEKQLVTTRLSVVFFGIACLSGLAAWFFSSRIEMVEHELQDLQEQTATKWQLFQLLREILDDRLQQDWTLPQLAEGIAQWNSDTGTYRRAVRALGTFGFAQFLMDHAKRMNLVIVREELDGDNFLEYYRITSSAEDQT